MNENDNAGWVVCGVALTAILYSAEFSSPLLLMLGLIADNV